MSIKKLVKPFIKIPIEIIASRFGHHRRSSSEPRLWVMMYHRVLPKSDPRYLTEEPGMIVEPDTFRMHLQTLKNEFTMITLNEWVTRKKNNQPLPLKACAITFDDGWLDNYEYAFPILQQEQVPATLFAVSDMVGSNQTFWPNRIQTILQQPTTKLENIAWINRIIGEQASEKSTIDKESSASIIYSLKYHSDSQLIDLIGQAESDLGIFEANKPVLINHQQLITMANSGLVDIGSHTCRHVRLVKGLDADTYNTEISNSKKQLEEIINKSVNLFCYPNGDYCDAAVAEVEKHYDAAVTTQNGINNANSLLFTLSRFGVHEDVSHSKRKLLSRISNLY